MTTKAKPQTKRRPRGPAEVGAAQESGWPAGLRTDADALLQAGSLVRVRQRTFLVEEVHAIEGFEPVVHLACIDDDAEGQRLSVIWSAEVDATVIASESIGRSRGNEPDDPRVFAAYLQVLRWSAVSSTDPTLFQAPFRAGIVPKPYQLEPLRKALALPRVNLFLADDVGLGKTIEAGLVLKELVLRQRVRRVVIACPASVLLQWRDELAQRFGLSFVIMDKAYVQARRRERGFGVNAWMTHRQFLISHALLRDEEYQVGLRDWLGEFSPYSLFILDEAHVAAPASASRYAVDTQITRAVRDIAKRFEHRLFLSATPHNGHSNSFSALMEILDPQRFTRGVPVRDRSALEPVMVRRLKRDLQSHIGAQIPRRETIQIELDGLPLETPELVLAEKLAEYTEILEKRLATIGSRPQSLGRLVVIALQKRLLSSIEAFAVTLSVHRQSIARMRTITPGPGPASAAESAARRHDEPRVDTTTWSHGVDDTASAPSRWESGDDISSRTHCPTPGSDGSAGPQEDTDDHSEQVEDSQIARATEALWPVAAEGRAEALLDEMTALAERSRHLPEVKFTRFLDWVREHQCPNLPYPGEDVAPRLDWTHRRVIVFTEYADTLRYLMEQLEAVLGKREKQDRVLVLHGGMDDEGREQIKAAFNSHDHGVRILLATDAAREGINLQAQCADLFHYDLPWNPGRMEQRNGRVDRTLQPEPVVRCHYFVHRQRPEDSVLEALVKKSVRIHEEVGSLAEVIDERLARTLVDGISRTRAPALVSKIEMSGLQAQAERSQRVRDQLEMARTSAVETQLEELRRLWAKAQSRVDMTPDRLREAVQLGLTLLGAPPLSAQTHAPGTYRVAVTDKMMAADPTWWEILDNLRPPRTRRTPVWEWRAQCEPRPVTFEPPTTLASHSVHLHLQHPFTCKALLPFQTQAFAEDHLARITIVVDPNHPRKRILALARLSLFGRGATRLHDEIVAAVAFWVDGDDRARLEPCSTPDQPDEEERALMSLAEVLTLPCAHAVSPDVVKTIMRTARADEAVLWDALKRRAALRRRALEVRLRTRAEAEAEEIRRVLRRQHSSLERELRIRKDAEREAAPMKQLVLSWCSDEQAQKEQYDADTKYIEHRLAELQNELASEPVRMRELYEVKHHRLDWVGLVYLWPNPSQTDRLDV